MNCTKCGQSLPNNAKFCANCGTNVVQMPKISFCNVCGAKIQQSDLVCPMCGVKVSENQKQQLDSANPLTGKYITELSMVSMYEGTPKVGVAKASGHLSIYSDRIEFKKQLGNSMVSSLGLVGMAIAKNKTKKDPIDIYPTSQIKQLSVGKYGGIYNTLVVNMQDDTTVSFCPVTPGSSSPQNIINSMQQYLK